MTDTKELAQALEFLSPAALDYSQWTMVGMALKENGFPLQMWEEWSSRDAARFRTGECARKWAGFRGAASPVTVASIFDLAYKNGYASAGQALDWESEISTDGRAAVLSPAWVEEQELEMPETWEPAEQLIRYLQALFEPTENVGYVTETWEKDGRWMPTKGCWDRTAGQLIEGLSRCGGDIGSVLGDYSPEAGAWIRFNPLDGNGCKNDNVSEYRFALVESDSLSLGKQNALMRRLELPIAALVYSGGKSLHAIVRIDAASYGEYQKRVEHLYAVCRKNGLEPDTQNKNPSRLSRMPGVMRRGQKQYLLATNIGKSSWNEWAEWIEEAADDLPDEENLAEQWGALPPLAQPLIGGLLRQGHKMLLAGPSKAGKSFALIELTIAIAEGASWMGRFDCARGKVLYINLELDRASCLHRFKDVYDALGIAPVHLTNIDLWNLRGASAPLDKLAPKLIRRAAKKNYMAIILDPIYKVITGDENSADQMARFCNQFDRICRELGCAVIYCHHHSKGMQGGKKSMDRASGSGVFARDPDALLDLIEIVPPESLWEHEEDRAECAARMAALKAAGQDGDVGPDDAFSPVQMRAACERLLSADRRGEADQKAREARKKARGRTAWRVEGTLREFARFEPVNLWFDYPVHRPDTGGVLADVQPEEDAPRWQKGLKNNKAAAKERSRDKMRGLEAAFDAVKSTGDTPNLYNMAEYMGVTAKTVRNRIAAHGGYWVDGANVGKK